MMRILAPPGVFTPRSDTWLLAGALRDAGPRARSVLDLCTGSGALAIAAALHGARCATAVDVSRAAVLATRLNARLNGVHGRVRAVRGNLLAAVAGERFDLIVANPPYLPAAAAAPPRRGAARAWDAGRDGRALLDRICDEAPRHLRPGGALLVVHSSLCGEEESVERLRARGLRAEVAVRHRGPLGPLLAARADLLERRGLLAPGAREEEMLVVRAAA